MVLAQYRRMVGVFASSQNVECALDELQAMNFPDDQVSVIAQEPEGTAHTPRRPTNAQEGTAIGAIAGGTVGSLIGFIIGIGTVVAVPGLGPVMLMGTAAMALTTTLTTGVMGATAGGLLGALVGYGIPKDRAGFYRDRVYGGQYLVMVRGTEADIRYIESIFSRWQAQDVQVFAASSRPTFNPELLLR